MNGATCSEDFDNQAFTCSCPPGFTGVRCEYGEYNAPGCPSVRVSVCPSVCLVKCLCLLVLWAMSPDINKDRCMH